MTKHSQVYHLEVEKNKLDFSDLGLIFKVTGGLAILKNGTLAPYLLKEWMYFHRISKDVASNQDWERAYN